MSDKHKDVLITAYLFEDLAKKDFDAVLKLAGQKTITAEGVLLVQKDDDGEVHVTETGDHLGRKGAKIGGGVGLVVDLFAPPLLAATAAGAAAIAGPAAVPAPRPRDRREPRLRIVPQSVVTPPPAGRPGHGSKAVLRRQPVRIVGGRFEGGYTDVYEIVCPDCGDHRDLDYSEVSWRLQWLRGPHTLEAGLAAFHIHLGLT